MCIREGLLVLTCLITQELANGVGYVGLVTPNGLASCSTLAGDPAYFSGWSMTLATFASTWVANAVIAARTLSP